MNLLKHFCTDFSPRLATWLGCAVLALALGATVAPRADAADHQSIEAALRRHILQHGPWQADIMELRLLPFAAATMPMGLARYRVLQPSRFANPGLHNFHLAVEIDGKETQRLWLRGEILIFDQVVVAAGPLARQELIGAQDLRLERREISGRGARPFRRVEDVIGKQPTRAIDANEVLTPSVVDRPTVIKRGSAVKLIFESAALRVETAGVAEEAGKLGDLIQVKNASSGKVLRGVVLDARQVRLN
jgi:flagella basal body P-ring formation protein FlgA